MKRLVEILVYTLKPQSRPDFHAIMRDISVPLHREHGIDVVWFGPSMHDAEGYGLFRSFTDLDDLNDTQQSFYQSEAWRSGPRREIVNRIETSNRIILPMTATAIEELRHSVSSTP